MHFKSKSGSIFSTMALIMVSLSACNGTGTENSTASGNILGQDQMKGTPMEIPPSESRGTPTSNPDPSSTATPGPTATPTPTTTPTPTPTSSTPPVVGTSCQAGDDSKYCLGLKYVVYANSAGTPVVTQEQAINNLKTVNNLWSQCDIAFQIDEYLAADPTEEGLTYNTANYAELEDIRETFETDNKLLLVTTGKWNRSGSLGSTGANAWANMPGEDLYGVVMESAVGTYANIIAHELGHYLNLDHASNSANLMNPIIYDTSTSISSAQCNEARSAIEYFWKKMLR